MDPDPDWHKPSNPESRSARPTNGKTPVDRIRQYGRRFTHEVKKVNRNDPLPPVYSPVLRQASLPETITVPWWNGRTLRYQYD